MNFTSIDELDRMDEAFAGNTLLATMPPAARALIEPSASIVEFRPDEVVHERGSQVHFTYFPFGPTMLTMVVELIEGRSIEVASVGHEGAAGGIVSCGHAPAFARSQVLVAGPALRVPMAAVEEAKMRSGQIRNLFCRFSDYLLAQTMQSAACNTYHTIAQRAARWLLTAEDRAGSRIVLTQEAFAGLLGAQRTTVNAVVRELSDLGLITTRRGAIEIVDRAGLKRLACECYDAVERHFASVIGPTGNGGSVECD